MFIKNIAIVGVLALGLVSPVLAQTAAPLSPQPNAPIMNNMMNNMTDAQARVECDTRMKAKPVAKADEATAMRTCMDLVMRGGKDAK